MSQTLPPLTLEQGIILTAFTGILMCPFEDFQEAIQNRLGRPIWTHELGEPAIWQEIKEAFTSDFMAICASK